MARRQTEMSRLDRARRRTGGLVNLLVLVLVLGVLVLAIVVWRERRQTVSGTARTTSDPAAATAPRVPAPRSDSANDSRGTDQ